MSAIPAFSFITTADEVATAFSQEIKGKNVLITGTSLNGIGFETARVIAKHANLVIITGYNDERLPESNQISVQFFYIARTDSQNPAGRGRLGRADRKPENNGIGNTR
ncbi:hypothetical protein B0H13DRAFT_1878473 [Mycena leptocephala]|nr:hypothetical protein B0H13DRAFT_1878473 [Mycena leptocephala]